MKRPLSQLTKGFGGLVSVVKDYCIGSVTELKQVSWPNRSALTQYTVLTLVTIAISVAVITGIDYGLQNLSQRFLIR